MSSSSHQHGTSRQTGVFKRNHTESTHDEEFGPERHYVFVPECNRCRDRGFICRTDLHAQEGQHSCSPCRLKKANCSVIRGKNRVVEQLFSTFSVKEEPGLATEVSNSVVSRLCQGAGSSSGPPSKRQRNEDTTTIEETFRESSESIPPFAGYMHLLSGRIEDLDETIRKLHSQLSDFQNSAKQARGSLNEITKLLSVQESDPREEIANIEKVVHKIVLELADSQLKANGLVRHLHAELSNNHQKTDRLGKILYVHQQKHRSENLYAEGHIVEAARSLLTIVGSENEGVIASWIPGFTRKCITELERLGDEGIKTGKQDDALAAYSAALSLDSSTSYDLLVKWVKIMLLRGSTNDALDGATAKFKFPRIRVYHAICMVLEVDGHIMEAIKTFRQMQADAAVGVDLCKEREQWGKSFQQRCAHKLGELADSAMHCQNYKEAIEYFSTMLLLDEVDRVDTLIKRSKAWATINSWENALKDANEVIILKESSRQDDQKHMEVVEALETMLLKL